MNLSKHYDKLQPHERFQLALKAQARGDEADVEALKRTCPKETYRMNEAAVTDRFDALFHLVAAYLMATEQTKGKLVIHEAAQELVSHLIGQAEDAVRFAYWRGFADGGNDETGKLTDEIQDLKEFADRMLEAIRQGIMSRARGDLEAFETVCKERVGLNADSVLAGSGVAECLDWLDREELMSAEPVEIPELKEAFISAWDFAVS